MQDLSPAVDPALLTQVRPAWRRVATWRRAHPLCRHTQYPYGTCMAVLTMG